MSKVVLDDVVSGYGLSKINENFQKIEDELNNKVLYRDNPVDEINTIEQDIDLNGFSLYNVEKINNVAVDTFTANVDVVAGSIASVNTVATNISNVNIVAGIDDDVTAVAVVADDVAILAPYAPYVGAYATGIYNNLASEDVGKGASLVGYRGGEGVKEALDARLPELDNYAALDAYDGYLLPGVYVRGVANVFDGGHGVFRPTTDTPAAANGIYRQDAAGRWWKRDYDKWVSPKWFGAKADGATNDASAITAAHAASRFVDYGDGTYAISFPENSSLVSYSGVDGVEIKGSGAKIYDLRNYVSGNFTNVFEFVNCKNVNISLDYQGQPIVNKTHPSTGIGYIGATFVALSGGCDEITVKGDLKYLRYGVRAGDYVDYTKGENNRIKVDLRTVECGYPVAFYLTTGVDINLYSIGSHRTAYLAGVKHGKVRAYFKDQYIGPIQVLCTDATENGLSYPNGVSRGCSDLDIVAHDLGSTTYVNNSFCAGVSMSRGDSGTTFQNLKFDVYVKASDTVASKLSAFGILNDFLPYQPSYPSNWDQSFRFRNITLSGVIDRSDQTVAENSGNGEIYIYTLDSGSNYATVSGIDIVGFKYHPGSGAKTRGFYFVAPGHVGTSRIDGCDFGTETPFTLITNSTSLVSFSSTRLRGSYLASSDSPYNSAASFSDCTIHNHSYQPLVNKTFFNTTIKGSRTAVATKIVDSGTLSGNSVTLTAAIPGGSVVLGVTGIITADILGATGYQVGTAGDLSRYANRNDVAAGSVFNIDASTASTPLNYAGTTNLVITAKTSAFTGGSVRIAIHYVNFTNLII